ncbi:hypothetical protein HK27_13405 [Acetobacter orientalis]|uniref:hypothetical protein n=1 Tax=Acetobacter orientalis TaxID=146474 RepID=UPI000A36A7EF|nr:hypothetical protein [Acetobacter orientalis]OUJ14645.1 hypothetical protein HK27_13405 [Acetobacter orientalis]
MKQSFCSTALLSPSRSAALAAPVASGAVVFFPVFKTTAAVVFVGTSAMPPRFVFNPVWQGFA